MTHSRPKGPTSEHHHTGGVGFPVGIWVGRGAGLQSIPGPPTIPTPEPIPFGIKADNYKGK